MHTQPMSESDGKFEKDWKPDDRPCRECKVSGQVFYRVWESSDGAYEDYKYNCRACGKVWWIDGIDS